MQNTALYQCDVGLGNILLKQVLIHKTLLRIIEIYGIYGNFINQKSFNPGSFEDEYVCFFEKTFSVDQFISGNVEMKSDFSSFSCHSLPSASGVILRYLGNRGHTSSTKGCICFTSSRRFSLIFSFLSADNSLLPAL